MSQGTLNARAAYVVRPGGEGIFDPVSDPTPLLAVAVTPADEMDEEEPPAPTGNAVTIAGGPYRALSVTAAGTIHLQFVDGSDDVIPAGSLAAGLQHDIWFTGIFDTDTTATGIIAWK